MKFQHFPIKFLQIFKTPLFSKKNLYIGRDPVRASNHFIGVIEGGVGRDVAWQANKYPMHMRSSMSQPSHTTVTVIWEHIELRKSP